MVPTQGQAVVQASSLTDRMESLQETRATGRLDIRSPNGTEWSLYVFFGRLVWARGGSHPEQRWFRLASLHLSHLQPSELQQITRQIIGPSGYSALVALAQTNRVGREAIASVVKDTLDEVVFDILYEESLFLLPGSQVPLEYSLVDDKLENPLSLLRVSEVLGRATHNHQQWRTSGLAGYSPNTAPIIQYPTLLRGRIDPSEFQTLYQLVNGKHSLRNLALLMKRDLTDLVQYLYPFLTEGLIRLDYEQERKKPEVDSEKAEAALDGSQDSVVGKQSRGTQPLIVCIDDSPIICYQLEQELTQAGYRVVGIQEPTKAIPTLLKSVPDLIFLDLVMPNTNGYEICALIRRTRKLKHIPVIILTSNAGLIFQARARMVGSTDYLNKPIQHDQIMRVIDQHLPKR